MIKDRIALLEKEIESATKYAANLYYKFAVENNTELLPKYERAKKWLADLEADLKLAKAWLSEQGK